MKLYFHPYVNHFPIAFLILEAFLVALWLRGKDPLHERFSYLVLKLIVACTPLVMLAGLADARGLPRMVRPHAGLALCLFLSVLMRFFLRRRFGFPLWQSRFRTVYLALLAAGVVLTFLTGHWGGMLVYT